MKFRIKIYQLLVNRVPAIQRKYHGIRQQKKGTKGRVYAWTALLFMNLAWLLGKRKFGRDDYNPDAGKKIPTDKSESAFSLREPPNKLAERLKQYDVISFDVFDTLILRPFACPSDLFFAVGEKLKYLDFERIRREVEGKARQKAYEKRKSYEVTLSEIYEWMEEETGIKKEVGMQAEISTEEELCFGNPYLLEVFVHLKNCGKKIICTSDMYLPLETIRRMVEKSGFEGISEYFISCEQRASKGDGALYRKVKEKLGQEKRYIHVGDYPVSDVEKAKRSGFAAEFYQNVNIAGMPYRAEDMSIITGSMYRGIVNAHIHNGLKVYSREYELGFIYGGIFVLGYCQWIHEYVRTHKIDKVLFLSRDGDILNQVYAMLYPDESGKGKTEYVYWSRLAAAKLGAEYFKYDYFRRFIHHKVNQAYKLKQIFTSMEIEDMLPEMCIALPELGERLIEEKAAIESNRNLAALIRKEVNITEESKLTDKNAWLVEKYLKAHWEEVLLHYKEQSEAGKQYYREVLKGCRRVAAVDVGWAGSGAVILNQVVNEVWQLNCEVIGLLAGTNTVHNAEPNMSEPLLQSGQLVSYLFSQGHNRDVWKWHDAAKGHNLLVEGLLGSTEGSLRKIFFLEKEKIDFDKKEPDISQHAVSEIHVGVRDFIKHFVFILERKNKISNYDAYAPIRLLMSENNKKIMKMVRNIHPEL